MKIGIVADGDRWPARAERLARQGHDVVLLAPEGARAPSDDERPGSLRRACLPEPDVATHAPPHRLRAERVDAWLRAERLDLVHLGSDGSGFYALGARLQGAAHEGTIFVLELEASMPDAAPPATVDALEVAFMARECAARVDAVHGDSRSVQAWARERGGASASALGPGVDDLERWLEWHESLDAFAPSPLSAGEKAETPLVSLCVTVHDRARYLEQALDSIESQDYEAIEVVLVDDGSTDDETLELLTRLEPRFASRGWSLVRQENLYLGAARNRAVESATGELLVFLDDDDWLPPHAVSSFVRAATVSGAAITTSFVEFFDSEDPPAGTRPSGRWLPLGPALAAGAFRNVFGSATSLIRRDAFEWLSGYTEDVGVGHEDWELYARAGLEGFRVEVLPEPLLWYRKVGGTMLERTSESNNLARSLRPYLGRGETIDAIVQLAAASFHAEEARAREYAERERAWAEALDEERRACRELRDELQRLQAQEESDIDVLLESARLLASRGRGDTVHSILEEVDALVGAMGHPEVQMNAGSVGASILAELGHVELAESWLARAIEAGQGNENPSHVLGVLLSSAETLSMLGRNEAARQHLASAVVLAHRTQDDRAVTSTLLPKATVHAGLGEQDVAWEVLERASAAARERGDGRTLAQSLLQMAELVERMGESDRAVHLLVEAMRAARQTGQTGFLLEVLTEASEQLRRVGSGGEATSVLRSAEALARQSGNALAYARLQEMTARLSAEPGA